MSDTTDNMKPIRNFPGYFVTREGQVYSTKREGGLKQLKPRTSNSIMLCGPFGKHYKSITDIVASAWGSAE